MVWGRKVKDPPETVGMQEILGHKFGTVTASLQCLSLFITEQEQPDFVTVKASTLF